MMLKRILTLLLCTAFLPQVQGQTPYFNNFYNMSELSGGGSVGGVVLSSDSQYVVTGVTSDSIGLDVQTIIFLSAFDFAGNLKWKTYLGHVGLDYYGSYQGSLKLLRDGNYILCGNIGEEGGPGSTEHHYTYGYVVKFTPEGDTIWHRRYRDTTVHERFHALVESEDGSIMITGYKGEGPTNHPTPTSIQYRDNSALLVKLDSVGNRLWERVYYTHSNYDMTTILAKTIVEADDGGLIVGTTRYYGGHDRNNFIFKVDSLGQSVKWELKVGSPNTDSPELNIVQSIAGDYLFVGGYTGRMAFSGSYYYPQDEMLFFGRFTGGGDTIWTKQYEIPNDTIGLILGYNIKEMPSGDLVMLALKADSTAKALILKTDSSGSEKWHRQYWTYDIYTVENWPNCMDLNGNGGAVFTGYMRSTFYYPPRVDTLGQFTWLVSTDSLGCVEPGCDSADYTGVQVIFPPGHNEANLRLHPNPAADWVTITFDKNAVADKLRVFDLAGREVLSVELGAGTYQTTLSVSGIPSGVYIVELRNNGKPISAEKLVIH